MAKPLILIVCPASSARSQMAEVLMRHIRGDQSEAASAGIDISHYRSKSIDEFLDCPIRYLITVCDNARDNFPYVPGAKTTLHWPFNPRLEDFRRVRDLIRDKIETTPLPYV